MVVVQVVVEEQVVFDAQKINYVSEGVCVSVSEHWCVCVCVCVCVSIGVCVHSYS